MYVYQVVVLCEFDRIASRFIETQYFPIQVGLGKISRDFHLLVYAYSNYSTAEVGGLPVTSYNIARVNDEVIKMFYKDALKKKCLKKIKEKKMTPICIV